MTAADKVRFLAERLYGAKAFPLGCTEDYNAQIYPKAVQNVEGQWNIFIGPMDVRLLDPLASIADAFGCQAKLPEEKRGDFLLFLRVFGGAETLWNIANATSEQRSNAIIRALGGNPDE